MQYLIFFREGLTMTVSRRALLGAGILVALILGSALNAFAQNNSSYTVQRGDSLDKISANFDVQTACLAKANNLADPSKIKPGQLLTIDLTCPRYDGFDIVTNPRTTAATTTTTTTTSTSSDLGQGGGAAAPSGSEQSYTVVRGDTLDTIGQKLNVSVVSLRLANDIGPRDRLKIGQTLTIPAGAPAYGLFPAISNPLNPTSVSTDLGQGGGGPEVGPNDQMYVVQQRDTLDTIGARFDTQVACIAQNNNIKATNLIYPGQSIVISAACPHYDGFDIVTNPRSNG
jgi:LysM repeat protein